jgi:hypothetical protein
MSNTKRSSEKEKRDWNDLLSEKKEHIKRRIQEEDAKKTLRDFELERKLREMYPDDPPF